MMYTLTTDHHLGSCAIYFGLNCLVLRKKKAIALQEKLRENVSSIVKQSAALNRPGSENMKPRQLSDAIYQEVG